MAGLSFIEFSSLEELKKYCEEKSLHLVEQNGYSIIARVVDKNNVPWDISLKDLRGLHL